MVGFPQIRARRRNSVEDLRRALVAGIAPEHVLASLAPAYPNAMWTLLLDEALANLGVSRHLQRRGNELVGRCDACGHESSLSVGREQTWCSQCGLKIASLDYLRLQLDRHRASHPIGSL